MFRLGRRVILRRQSVHFSDYSLDNYQICVKLKALEVTVEKLRRDIDTLQYTHDLDYTNDIKNNNEVDEIKEEYFKGAG